MQNLCHISLVILYEAVTQYRLDTLYAKHWQSLAFFVDMQLKQSIVPPMTPHRMIILPEASLSFLEVICSTSSCRRNGILTGQCFDDITRFFSLAID